MKNTEPTYSLESTEPYYSITPLEPTNSMDPATAIGSSKKTIYENENLGSLAYQNENLGWTIATLFLTIVTGCLFIITVNEEHVAQVAREHEIQAWREQTSEKRSLAASTPKSVKEDDSSEVQRDGDNKETIRNPAAWVE